MRILSIDFDYFVDASMEERNVLFPDGHDDLPPQIVSYLWEQRCKADDSIEEMGVIEDYNIVCDFLKTLTKGTVLVADSHKEIEELFDNVKSKGDLELINIDFHHDMYVTGGNTLDCGNWLRFLIDLKPDTKVTWVRREDSDVESLSGSFPYYHTTNIKEVLHGQFDHIFLCFSSPWTPPHLFYEFSEMASILC